MTKIVIVGGGYAGFYAAQGLERELEPGEADVTVIDPRPYWTYQPFLPEVVRGAIEPRHVVVPHRSHLKKTQVVTGEVSKIDHAAKAVTVKPADGDEYTIDYDAVIVTAGSVSRTFPIPGIAENAIGMKQVEEAVWVRNKIIDNFAKAATMAPGPERDRLLTFVVVGGGFAGIEAFAEMRALATDLLELHPSIQFDDVQFHLIEAAGRIMPEVSEATADWVIRNLAERGAIVHLNTQCKSAVDGIVETDKGEQFPTDVIVWTAGVMAAPFVKSSSDLPVDERGRIRVRADLRVEGDNGLVEGAWAAGDVAAVPDLSGGGVQGYCVPNAQHAVRQGKLLAQNVASVLRGGAPQDYVHNTLGAVAGLGPGVGAFKVGDFSLTGFPAWLAHRGYHGFAIPTLERKVRVASDWAANLVLGHDFASISQTEHPRAFFERFAAKPKPESADDKKPASQKEAPAKAAPARSGSKPAAK